VTKLTQLPARAEIILEDFMSEFPDLNGVILLVDFPEELKGSSLPECVVEVRDGLDSTPALQAANMMGLCLRAAHSIAKSELQTLDRLYRTKPTEGETENDI